MSKCDFDQLITLYETKGLDTAMKTHLQQCHDCQTRLTEFLLLTGAMTMASGLTGIDMDQEVVDVELPPMLKKKIGAQRKKWQQSQLTNVLEFKNIKETSRQNRLAERLFGDQPRDLPKAAFPDDLDNDNDGNDGSL